MARGSRVANEYGFVQDVADIYIGYNNQSMQITEGYAAQYGVIRQFWPSTTITQTGIVMTTTADESYAVGNTTAKAIVTYDAQSGELILSDETDTKRVVGINPPPRSTGQYLFKLDIVSGNIQGSDATGVWLDTNSEGTLGLKEYWIDQSGNGFNEGEVTVSFAEDDGAGAPVGGTTVAKNITVKAEVLSAVICMSTQPWLLDNTEYNELAECWVLTIPLGWYDPAIQQTVDTASINGEYGYPKGIQFSEIYACSWTALITVQVDVVSGGPVIGGDGEQTGVAYSTSERRRWKIEATPGNTSDAVVDVTISDGIESVVKRVTMSCESVLEESTSSISTDFTRADVITDFNNVIGGSNLVYSWAGIGVDPNGTVVASNLSGDAFPTFPQNWNNEAPTPTDPENFECRVVKVSGTDMPDLDTWFNCSSAMEWQLWETISPNPSYRPIPSVTTHTNTGDYQLQIREVGRPETVQIKPFTLTATASLP